jgi:predicted N-acetyltransferase YhbS
MPIQIRTEQSFDLPGIRRVNELAFGRAIEAQLVDELRAAGAAILSLLRDMSSSVAVERERQSGIVSR